MHWLQAMSPYVPALQTLLWCALITVVLAAFHKQGRAILDAVRMRVERGSSLRAGPVEFGEDLRQLQHVEPVGLSAMPEGPVLPPLSPQPSWADRRDKIYRDTRGVFLVHVIKPSGEPGQLYDIFVYLIRHKSDDFTDVSHAEFFFGHYWGNQIFRREPKGGLLGMSTSAYGPFLCTCRVAFKDGYSADLYRYVDFEMGRLFEQGSDRALERKVRKPRGGRSS